METKAALKALSALAHDTRLAVYRYLVEVGPEGVHAGAIAERLGLPGATLSFHLKELSHAELVESQQEGRFVRYIANLTTVQAMVAYLTETCCGGRPEMCVPVATPLPLPMVKRKPARPQ
ncbi:ArsR family transcriptional regulator [Tahibacter aquaticus]|uniref:ArsR family transcriptional regulator n=1 Tax=Tahibacter aquaticus TaxID=520092 RepID=A0A4R6YPG9_9GAMM|nr:helix-turn-helix domain-containing protein [Tahibacter aquaticus]TDR39650.1 ArsR family transcriptional regulator [Tahibacter aquaticus]